MFQKILSPKRNVVLQKTVQGSLKQNKSPFPQSYATPALSLFIVLITECYMDILCITAFYMDIWCIVKPKGSLPKIWREDRFTQSKI